MAGLGLIDWDASTKPERKALHSQVLILKKRLHIDWISVFQRAFGPKDNVGLGYEDNLRQGRIAPERAYKLFVWLQENDPALASNVEDDILRLRENTAPEQAVRWETLLARGIFSNVAAFKYSGDLGMASFARREPLPALRLKLLEQFYFEVIVPFDGTLIAFQGYKGLWYPQLIIEDNPILEVTSGAHIIPSNEEGQPYPLHEETDMGKHSFAFLLVQDKRLGKPIAALPPAQAIPAKMRDDLARQIFALPDEAWRLFRINLAFG